MACSLVDFMSQQIFGDEVYKQNVPKVPLPQNHCAEISVWTDLSVCDVELLSQLVSADHLRKELAQIFHLFDYETDQRSAILVDLYYYTIQFARDNQFSKEQTSAFFSIVKKTHEVCVETPFGNVGHCFCYFKDMVLCHAVKRPPFSIDLFNADQVRIITEYVINTYFRHYKLYKYTFTPRVTLDLNLTYVGTPLTPEPSDANLEESPEEEEPVTEAPVEPAQDGAAETKDADDEAVTELRKLIRQHLSEELKKLRVSVEQQMKNSEEGITKRLQTVETDTKANVKGSGKARKK